MANTVNTNISTADALWALIQGQTKSVKRELFMRFSAENEAERKPKSQSSSSYVSVANKVRQEYKEGKGVTLHTPEEIDNYLNSL